MHVQLLKKIQESHIMNKCCISSQQFRQQIKKTETYKPSSYNLKSILTLNSRYNPGILHSCEVKKIP